MTDRVSSAGWSTAPSGLSPLTLPIEHTQDHSPPTDADQDPRFGAQGAQFWVLAFIAGLIGLWALRRGSSYLQQSAIAVNAFNFMTVTLMVALGLLLFKWLFSVFPVPGLTALVHAV